MATYGKRPSTVKNMGSCPEWRQKTNVFDDPCTVNVRESQSQETGEYPVTNFFRRCGEPVMTNCTLNQTFTYPKVHGISQCNVNYDSDLRYAPLTNLNNIHQLQTRPYLSPGYRGAGANSLHLKDLESGLIQGNSMTTYKGSENSNEVYIDRFQWLDQRHPQQINHCIEPFTRGGILSRELVRRLAYDDYCHMLNKPRPY